VAKSEAGPKVNLVDGRRTDLAYSVGKERGGQVAERAIALFARRSTMQASFMAWRKFCSHGRGTNRIGRWLAFQLATTLEVCFGSWRTVTLQLVADTAETRLSRSEETAHRMALMMYAGQSQAVMRALLYLWFKEAARPKVVSSASKAGDDATTDATLDDADGKTKQSFCSRCCKSACCKGGQAAKKQPDEKKRKSCTVM